MEPAAAVKPTHVWSLFGLCLAALLAAMGWSSAIVLRLERSQAAAQAQAALEENARLALWRMDSTVGSLVAQENARPYFQYRAFYSASSPYTNMFAESASAALLLPSPLLLETPSQIVLHFQIEPGGAVTSPQVPVGPLRDRALALGHTTPALLSSRTTRLADVRLNARQGSLSGELQRAEAPTPRPSLLSRLMTESVPQQKLKSAKEYEVRQQSYDALNKNTSNTWQMAQSIPASAVAMPVEEGTLSPLWMGDALLLVRRVRVGGASYQQGCWVDWPRLQQELLSSVQDLLPNARLERASASHGPAPDEERRLAALPVRLLPGAVAPLPSSISPVRISLAGAWAFLLLAALSVAVLLRGVMTLSERRRVFVSAVTHELRTPLTTFRLYTDMLAEGMVPGEEKRREYLGRLRAEAQRLGHLVENVLFYARLDSGRTGAVREVVDLADVLRQTAAGLGERTRKAGLDIVFDDRVGGPLHARVDRSAVEQIVVNLVDNACKYAAASTPPEIRIELARDERRALVRVRDHGPGLSAAERRRLFRPFSKSDREAANSAPGVGLGLALSRQLARALGGDLSLESKEGPGAAFLLALPI
jgi:signal transduction histidine kinase